MQKRRNLGIPFVLPDGAPFDVCWRENLEGGRQKDTRKGFSQGLQNKKNQGWPRRFEGKKASA